MIWAGQGSDASWLTLLLVLSVALWPVMVTLGVVWGRMQMEDDLTRLKRRALSYQREHEEV